MIAARIAVLVGVLGAAVSMPARAAAPTTGEVHQLEDDAGQVIATFVVRPGTSLDLPPGRYVHVRPDGTRTPVTVAAGARFEPGGRARVDSPPRAAERPPAVTTDEPVPAPPAATRRTPGRARRVLAPIAATLLPGSGHAIARRPGAAFGIFAAAAGLTFGAVTLGLGGNPDEGTRLGDPGRSAAREALRHGAFIATTDALALLWIGQIADAWVRVTHKRVRGRTRHAVALSLHRASTVGMRPGEPAMARYDDLSIGVLGQVMPRLWLGLADLSVHGRSGGRVTVQAGLRAAGRVLERDRVWLVVAGGAILQGTSGRSTLDRSDPEAPVTREKGRFGATLYAQLEARIFVLDRLSLDVGPRLSVPLTTRFYGGGAALPRYAPTLELVAGPGVYF